MPGWASLRNRWGAIQQRILHWGDRAITTWQAEGRLTTAEAVALRDQVASPAFQLALRSFGSQMAISFVAPFPLDSVVRPIVILLVLAHAAVRHLQHQMDAETWAAARLVHSPLVIILSAVPILGSYAYLASRPIRTNRLLLRVLVDAALSDLPFHLYARSGLRGLIAGRGAGAAKGA